jgi:hypothetical protein
MIVIIINKQTNDKNNKNKFVIIFVYPKFRMMMMINIID